MSGRLSAAQLVGTVRSENLLWACQELLRPESSPCRHSLVHGQGQLPGDSLPLWGCPGMGKEITCEVEESVDFRILRLLTGLPKREST